MAVARFFCHGDGVGGGGADTLSGVPKAASPVGGSGVSSPRKVLNLKNSIFSTCLEICFPKIDQGEIIRAYKRSVKLTRLEG